MTRDEGQEAPHAESELTAPFRRFPRAGVESFGHGRTTAHRHAVAIAIAIASGTLLTYEYDEGAPLASRLCSGACIGFAALGLMGFILALAFGLNNYSIAFAGAILLLPFLTLGSEKTRNQINADIDQALKAISRASTRPDRWAFIYFLFYAGVMILMSSTRGTSISLPIHCPRSLAVQRTSRPLLIRI